MEIWFLGDAVGYGASPNEAVEAIRGTGKLTAAVVGNHDWAAVHADYGMFDDRVAAALRWTSSNLSQKAKEYIEGLQDSALVELGDSKAALIHGSPRDHLWEYVHPSTHSEKFEEWLAELGVRVLGLGHTHVPFAWSGKRGMVFNPGSVGQPRDGDPRASYAILTIDGKKATAEVRRVSYDIDSSAKKIIAAGLPYTLARRLYVGA